MFDQKISDLIQSLPLFKIFFYSFVLYLKKKIFIHYSFFFIKKNYLFIIHFFLLKKNNIISFIFIFIYYFILFWGKMVADHVTAHLIGYWYAGETWGCVTILALSLDGVPLWDQSILSSPSTVLMVWLGDIP